MVFDSVYEKGRMWSDQCSKSADSSAEERTDVGTGVHRVCKANLAALSAGNSGIWDKRTDSDGWSESVFWKT